MAGGWHSRTIRSMERGSVVTYTEFGPQHPHGRSQLQCQFLRIQCPLLASLDTRLVHGRQKHIQANNHTYKHMLSNSFCDSYCVFLIHWEGNGRPMKAIQPLKNSWLKAKSLHPCPRKLDSKIQTPKKVPCQFLESLFQCHVQWIAWTLDFESVFQSP